MFNNFGTNGNGGMNYTGMTGQAIQKPRMINPITDDERKALRQNPADEFNLNISPEEAAEGFCTHKENDQYSVLVNADGTVTCKLCHATFNPDICTPEYVKDATERIQNVLETLKFLAVDLNADVLRGYFGYLPYIKKIPKLYKLVNNSFGRYNENTMFGGVQNDNNGANIFNMFNRVMNPAMPLYQPAYMNTPLYGGNTAQPQYNNMQPVNPFYTQPVQPTPGMNNQQAAMMGAQQLTAPVQPQNVVAPVNPTAPVQDDDEKKTVTTTVPVTL